MLKNCYQLCTTALQDTLLCKVREDYIFLWNRIAILCTLLDIKVYCICLMSNHFHIILQADPARIDLFFQKLKVQLGRYHKRKYGTSPAPRLEYKLFPVRDRKAFCQEMAYLLRNPYKARINNPVTYPWSCGQIYFSGLRRTGKRVAEMTFEERLSRLYTRQSLPGEMAVSPEGMILPETFIDTGFAETMFGGSPVLFFDLLKKWNLEDIVHTSHGESVNDPYSDEEIADGIRSICRDVFGNLSPREMDGKALARLTRQVYARYGASRAQLLRLLPVDDFLLDRML